MGTPLAARTSGVFRRHRLAVLASWFALAIMLAVVMGVREKIAGYQLVATVAPATDPAASALEGVLGDAYEDLTRSPTLTEIGRFFIEPGTRNQVGAYQSSDLHVSVDGAHGLVTLVVGDDLRQRTELSLELYLSGYVEHRRMAASSAADEVAALLEAEGAEVDERLRIIRAGDQDADVIAALEIRAAALRAGVEAVRDFPARTNGGVETSVLDVGRSVWETSVPRGLAAVVVAAVVAGLGLVVVSARDDRIRTRSDLGRVAADLDLLGVVASAPASGREDLAALRQAVEARLTRQARRTALISVASEESELEVVVRTVAEALQTEIVVFDERPDRGAAEAASVADAAIVVIGWGRVGVDEATLLLGRALSTGLTLVGAVIVGVPRLEMAPTFR